jgi:hypothetical protein
MIEDKGASMNIFKKLFRKKEKEEKKEECWYNNEHEKGEAVRNCIGVGASSGGGLDMAVTKTIARK